MIGALARATMDVGALPVLVTGDRPTIPCVEALSGTVTSGIVATVKSVEMPWVDELVHAGGPVVLIGQHPTSAIPFVDTDGEAAVSTIVEHLAGIGRRRIGLIAGPDHRRTMADRTAGWRRGLADAQLLQDDELMVEGDMHPRSGGEAALVLADRGVDAIVAANDPMAQGALLALRGAGVRVPDDVAVAGIDGAERFDGRLTTVRQPFAAIAETAVTELMAQIEGKRSTLDTLLLGDLLVGSTTAGDR